MLNTKNLKPIKTTCYDCLSYQSIPQQNGQTDYCIEKDKFLKPSKIEKKCKSFELK